MRGAGDSVKTLDDPNFPTHRWTFHGAAAATGGADKRKGKSMRLTAVLKAFVSIVATLGASFAGKVADVILGAIGAPKSGSERTLKGLTFVDRPVDLGKLGAELTDILRPEALHGDVREVMKAVHEEAGKRGPVWADQCLAAALEEHVVKPLQAVTDKPAAAKKGKAA